MAATPDRPATVRVRPSRAGASAADRGSVGNRTVGRAVVGRCGGGQADRMADPRLRLAWPVLGPRPTRRWSRRRSPVRFAGPGDRPGGRSRGNRWGTPEEAESGHGVPRLRARGSICTHRVDEHRVDERSAACCGQRPTAAPAGLRQREVAAIRTARLYERGPRAGPNGTAVSDCERAVASSLLSSGAASMHGLVGFRILEIAREHSAHRLRAVGAAILERADGVQLPRRTVRRVTQRPLDHGQVAIGDPGGDPPGANPSVACGRSLRSTSSSGRIQPVPGQYRGPPSRAGPRS